MGWRPPVASVPSPGRSAPEGLVVSAVEAIRTGSGLNVQYLSMNNAEPEYRKLSPVGFGHDGFRWHMRAYCHSRKSYRDFVLGRVLDWGPLPDLEPPAVEDMEWIAMVSLTIVPNPALTPEHQKVIEIDYGMKDGGVTIVCRQALLFYTLKRLGLNTKTAGAPEEHQIVLKNRDEIERYLNS